MSDVFDQVDAPTAAAEGGYVNNPADPGGETNRGITLAVARAAGYAGPMRDLSADQAKAIRKALYWDAARLDLVAPLSLAIAAEVYDCGINCGVRTAGTMLQRVLNVLNRGGQDFPDLKVDGQVGPGTAGALAALVQLRGEAGRRAVLNGIKALRRARYIGLAEENGRLEAFELGWLTRDALAGS